MTLPGAAQGSHLPRAAHHSLDTAPGGLQMQLTLLMLDTAVRGWGEGAGLSILTSLGVLYPSRRKRQQP